MQIEVGGPLLLILKTGQGRFEGIKEPYIGREGKAKRARTRA